MFKVANGCQQFKLVSNKFSSRKDIGHINMYLPLKHTMPRVVRDFLKAIKSSSYKFQLGNLFGKNNTSRSLFFSTSARSFPVYACCLLVKSSYDYNSSSHHNGELDIQFFCFSLLRCRLSNYVQKIFVYMYKQF